LFHIVVLVVTMLTGQVNEAMILVSSAAVGIQSKKNGRKNASRVPNWSAVAYAVLFVCE
jgi:hypothetical protein